jgi:predicted aconitase with swiveling domain
MKLHGRSINSGQVVGEALVSEMGISLFGGIDPESGIVVERGHDLEGQCVAGKVFVFPTGKGSTVGSYTLYRLKKAGKAPLAILNAECEPITAVGCIISDIPCVDNIPITNIATGMQVVVDGEQGIVIIHTPSGDTQSGEER